jgi:death on curing protein
MILEREPLWLARAEVDALHDASIRDFGGSFGVRDARLIESALARALNLWTYQPDSDLAALSAAYGFGLTKNHGYVDGNKRIGFLAMGAFLFINGYFLDAPETEAVIVMLEVAAGERDEGRLAKWIREHLAPR